MLDKVRCIIDVRQLSMLKRLGIDVIVYYGIYIVLAVQSLLFPVA